MTVACSKLTVWGKAKADTPTIHFNFDCLSSALDDEILPNISFASLASIGYSQVPI